MTTPHQPWPAAPVLNLNPAAGTPAAGSTHDDDIRRLARRTDPKDPGAPPWAWPSRRNCRCSFWSWWCSYLDPKATITMAVDYYTRTLPAFQTRLGTRLLGKGGVNCRKGQAYPSG